MPQIIYINVQGLHEAEIVMAILLVVTLAAIPIAFVRSTLADLFWALVLLVVSVEWLLVDKPVEGRVLLTLSKRHGLTSGDLLVVPALGLPSPWPPVGSLCAAAARYRPADGVAARPFRGGR